MGERRILVIGSQCEKLNPLSFLPVVAEELYKVMTDPERGACVSALEGEGLLIDPSVKDAKDAIKTAYRRAAKDGATLFIAYVGHGEKADNDFYLLPQDAQNPPDSDTAVHLTNFIKEVHKKAPGQVDGLVVLLDTCFSGVAAVEASAEWVRPLQGTLRFEVLSSEEDRPAADGCFSRSIIEGLVTGDADADRNGRITMNELFRYVTTKFRDAKIGRMPALSRYGSAHHDTVIGFVPKPELGWTSGKRLAVLIASAEYQDPELRKLSAPPHGVRALEALLAQPNIGGYQSRVLVNEPKATVEKAIDRMLTDCDNYYPS